MRDLRVLVTGGSGFIGTHLIRRLAADGAEVHASGRVLREGPTIEVKWHVTDLGSTEETRRLVTSVDPDIVFHLASRVTGSRDVDAVVPVLQANLAGSVNLLAALADTGCRRIVLANSMEEPRGATATPSSPYAAAKWASTGYARMFHQLWGVPVTVLRVAMAYGPEQRDGAKLLPYVINSMLAGERALITNGSRLIDWVYIEDVVDAFVAAALRVAVEGEVIDIGSGEPTSIRDTVEVIRALVGGPAEISYGALPDRPLDSARIADVSAAAKLLGWHPKVGLTDGLRRTIAWCADQRR